MGRKLQPLSLVITTLLLCIVNAIEECTTPHFVQGKCVSNDDCPSYVQILRERKPLKPKAQEYLNQSNCHGVSDPSTCCIYPKVEVTPPSPLVSILPPRSKCGILDSDQIVGGIEPNIYDYTWTVLIEYKTKQNTTTFKCGGSLISAKYVLTAAQCVYGNVYINVGAPTHIRLGEYDTTTNPDCLKSTHSGEINCIDKYVSIPIENIIIHPDYDPSDSFKNDLAIIRLSKEAPNTDTIKPICLPESDSTIGKKDNEQFFKIAGWETRQKIGKTTNRKLHLNVKFNTLNTCQKAYSPLRTKITEKQVCTRADWGNDFCQVDAGSPLMSMTSSNVDLIGIFSFSAVPSATPDFPGVYTKTYDYLEWIKSQMQL